MALDGTGWHPASWREPDARPRELLTAGYWVDLVTEAERGLLDLVTIEDTLGLQSTNPRLPDDRTDQVRGRLDAVLVAARVAPLTSHIGIVPTQVVTHTEPFHASKAIATLDYVSTGRAGVRVRISHRPDEAALFGRRTVPAGLLDGTDPAALADLFDEAADYVEVLRRLWDSWEDDAEIRDAATGRFVDREKLHYIDFDGRALLGPRPLDHPAARRRGSRSSPRSRHRDVAYRLVGRSADLGFVTPRDAGDAAAILGDDPRRAGGRGPGGETAARARRRRRVPRRLGRGGRGAQGAARRAARARVRAATRGCSSGRPPSWPTWRWSGGRPGSAGLRLRPGVLPHDLEQITRGLVPELQRRGAFRTGLRGRHPARALRPAPPRRTATPAGVEEEIPCRRKQIHLAAHFPGVNNTTVWSDPAAGSHIEFSSFVHFARTAERAKFDFLFLAEGLRLREQNGLIYDLDVVGRPDTFTVLAALAAVTDRLGLTGTINSTFNEPYEVARQFASLDHLSAGRAGWNVVTSWDAFTGENFRRGGFLPQEKRYDRAREFLAATRVLFDSWRGDEVVADKDSGTFLADPDAGRFAVHSEQFDIAGRFAVPRSPQGRPVILQAGDSEEGREFAAADADAIFTRHGTLRGRARLLRRRQGPPRPSTAAAATTSRSCPAATFVLGDTDADAQEKAHVIRRQQVSGQTAIKFAEQLWNRDLSDRDPDGPLPAEDPVVGENTISKGRASVRMYRDPVAIANEWRALAEAKKLSLREVVVETTARQSFIGSPATVAAAMDEFVQTDASDGFVLVPHITPGGLDDFADKVVPLLQERGSFRTEYTGTTLREHLGLRPLA